MADEPVVKSVAMIQIQEIPARRRAVLMLPTSHGAVESGPESQSEVAKSA